jgi:anthranilate synthase/aminodeoxychorismate synthase-like glutamine amidotransferase
MNVLLIDNFDSFSFNLVDEFARRGASVDVWRNDVAVDDALAMALGLAPPRVLVISPGPGAPADAGCCMELIARAAGAIPIFGVCLGHQAIVEAHGGVVAYAGEVVHGKAARIHHDERGLFEGLPSPMLAARYHSLSASRVPDVLRVTARTEGGGRAAELVMAVEHQSHRIAGVQFHPESILTPRGGLLIDNVLRWAAA